MKAGMWIDHRRAVIVELTEEGASSRIVDSDVEKHTRLSGGSRSVTPYGPQDVASEQRRDRQYQKHLVQYYDRLIESLGSAEALFLFGPGEAKTELGARIASAGAKAPPVVGVENADKMTDRQIAAKVRHFFQMERGET